VNGHDKQQARNSIFSEEALLKMRSPDELDAILPITNPVGWMGLIAVAVMIFAVILWSVFGSFTVKADGMGMIMDANGVTRVASQGSGLIDEVYVHNGEWVSKGARIAHVVQAKEEASTRMAKYGPGLAASQREAASRAHEFDSYRYQRDVTEYIRTAVDGIVDEVLVEPGSIVGSGTPVCRLRISDADEGLSGVLYIPVDKGKRVEVGQTIQLAPNGVDVSQSGSLIGTVRAVSQYPVSLQEIQKNLGNEQMAGWIVQAQQSSVMEIKFDLVLDDSNASGYLWTSSVGEHKPITAGSFVRGSIIIERRPPIEKVFYKLSQWLRTR